MIGPVTVLARDHITLLEVLRERGQKQQSMLHMDQHCDMRGLLVDPGRSGARWLYGAGHPDSGNILGHSVTEGWVDRVYWIHGADGGREEDLGTFLLPDEKDRAPFRWFGKDEGKDDEGWSNLNLDVAPFEDARPPERTDVWSLDWDYFAPFPSSEPRARRRVAGFLRLVGDSCPDLIFLCSSPGYASAHRQVLQEFLDELVRRQGGTLERRVEPWGGPEGAGLLGRTLTLARYLSQRPLVAAKKLLARIGPEEQGQ